MGSHAPHAMISTDGLADGCDRCLELAVDPADLLDDAALLDLVERFEAGEPARSEAEARAFHGIEAVMRAHARLERARNPELAR